jgi:hypothetical protein
MAVNSASRAGCALLPKNISGIHFPAKINNRKWGLNEETGTEEEGSEDIRKKAEGNIEEK